MNKLLIDRIRTLSQLANIDGEFDIRELAFIYGICIRHKIEIDQIPAIIAHPQPVIAIEDLSASDKVNYLTDVILLMVIDGKVLPSEINFCLDIAQRLGFQEVATRNLIAEISDQAGVRKKVSALPRINE